MNGGDSLSGKTVVLSDNIDLSDHLWTPIGNSESLIFAGIFNGDNKTIEGLTINYSGSGYVYSGLFGYVKGTSDTDVAVIKNVSVGGNVVVNNTSTSDKNYAGGIVGYVDANVEISYCSFSGSVSCTGAHSNYAGGIAGDNFGTISNCYSTGSVAASGSTNDYVGGLIGYCDIGNLSKVSYSYWLKTDGLNAAGYMADQDIDTSSCFSFTVGTDGDCTLSTGDSLLGKLNEWVNDNGSSYLGWSVNSILYTPYMTDLGYNGMPTRPADTDTVELSYTVKLNPGLGYSIYCSKGTSFMMTSSDTVTFNLSILGNYEMVGGIVSSNATVTNIGGSTYRISDVTGDVTLSVVTKQIQISGDESGTDYTAVYACMMGIGAIVAMMVAAVIFAKR